MIDDKPPQGGDQYEFNPPAPIPLVDPATGELGHDAAAKIYHIEPGISTRLGALLGVAPGPSFAFALSDTIFLDNRIPPRGFTNAAFETVQSPPVDYSYADGQYWDDTVYELPATTAKADVTLLYQTTTTEYVEFLRDENTTNSAGQDLYDAWVAQGRAAPELMAQASATVNITTGVPGCSASRSRPSTSAWVMARPSPSTSAGSPSDSGVPGSIRGHTTYACRPAVTSSRTRSHARAR